MTILVLWAASKYFVRTDCFSNKDGVSLRLCNVEELVLSGPCFADVNVETVTHTFQKWVFYQRIFGLFCGASEPLFIMCGRFIRSLFTIAEGQCLRNYVVLFYCGLRKLPFLMKYDCHGKYVLVNVCHVVVNL